MDYTSLLKSSILIILLIGTVTAYYNEFTYGFASNEIGYFDLYGSGGSCGEVGGKLVCNVGAGTGVARYSKAVMDGDTLNFPRTGQFNFTFKFDGDAGEFGWWGYAGLCRATKTDSDCEGSDARPFLSIERSHSNLGSFWCNASETTFTWDVGDNEACFMFEKVSLGGTVTAYYDMDCDGTYTLIDTCSLPDDNSEWLLPTLMIRKNAVVNPSQSVSWDWIYSNSSNYVYNNYVITDSTGNSINSDCVLTHLTGSGSLQPFWDDETLLIEAGETATDTTKIYTSSLYNAGASYAYLAYWSISLSCDNGETNTYYFSRDTDSTETSETIIVSGGTPTIRKVNIYASGNYGSEEIEDLHVRFTDKDGGRILCITNSSGECYTRLPDGFYKISSEKEGTYAPLLHYTSYRIYEDEQQINLIRSTPNTYYNITAIIKDSAGNLIEGSRVGVMSCPNNIGDDFNYWFEQPNVNCILLSSGDTDVNGRVDMPDFYEGAYGSDNQIMVVADHPDLLPEYATSYVHEMLTLSDRHDILSYLVFPASMSYRYCLSFVDDTSGLNIDNSVEYTVYDNDLGKTIHTNITIDDSVYCFNSYYDKHSYTIYANHENYTYFNKVMILDKEDKTLYIIRMTRDYDNIPDSEKFSLSGIVYNVDSGNEITDIRLKLICNNGRYDNRAFSNDTGFYLFESIPQNSDCVIDTDTLAYKSNNTMFSLNTNKTLNLYFMKEETNIVRLRIRSEDTTSNLNAVIPLSNTKIVLYADGVATLEAYTDSSGTTSIEGLIGDVIYNIEASREGYATHTSTVKPSSWIGSDFIIDMMPVYTYLCKVKGNTFLKNSTSAYLPVISKVTLYNKNKIIDVTNSINGLYSFNIACGVEYSVEGEYNTGINVVKVRHDLESKNIEGDIINIDIIFDTSNENRELQHQSMIEWIYSLWGLLKIFVLLVFIAMIMVALNTIGK